MTPLLLSMAMTLGADPNVDGRWLIVYAEEGSRRNTTWEQKVATMKEGTLSYNKEGEERTLHLKFDADQKLSAKLAVGKGAGEAKELTGVYIAGQDYLALSLNAGAGAKADTDKPSSGSFILILRRQR